MPAIMVELRAIHRFSGQYRFLSNFFELPTSIVWDGMKFRTVEHGFQAAKTLDTVLREMIRDAPTAAQAKAMGRGLKLRTDWHDVRIMVMEDLLQAKFAIPLMRKRLLDTGDLELVEGNDWRDTFWGVCGGVGENQLGKALMRIRAEIRGPAS